MFSPGIRAGTRCYQNWDFSLVAGVVYWLWWVITQCLLWFLFSAVSLSPFLLLLFHHPSPPPTSLSPLGRGMWQIGAQIGHDALHSFFWGLHVFETAMILALAGLLAVVEFPST